MLILLCTFTIATYIAICVKWLQENNLRKQLECKLEVCEGTLKAYKERYPNYNEELKQEVDAVLHKAAELIGIKKSDGLKPEKETVRVSFDIGSKYLPALENFKAGIAAIALRDKVKRTFAEAWIAKHVPSMYDCETPTRSRTYYYPIYAYLFYLRFKEQLKIPALAAYIGYLEHAFPGENCYVMCKQFYETDKIECPDIKKCYAKYQETNESEDERHGIKSEWEFYIKHCCTPQLNMAKIRVNQVKLEDLDIKSLEEALK